MKDYEIFEANIFEYTGLANAPVEEQSAFIQEFGRLLAITGIYQAGEKLSEKDQETLYRLYEGDEPERAQAFLALRDIDLEELLVDEAIRVKRPIIESGKTMSSTNELLIAIKANLLPEVLMLESAVMKSALEEIYQYIDSLSLSESQKMRLAEKVEDKAIKNVEQYIESVLPPEVMEEIEKFMDEDDMGLGLQLMLRHGIDYIQLSLNETHKQLSELKEQFSFMNEE